MTRNGVYSAYVSLANQQLWPFRKRVIFRSYQHKTHSRKLLSHSHSDTNKQHRTRISKHKHD